MHLEADPNMRSMKLPLAANNADNSAAEGAWVLIEPNDEEETGGIVGGGVQNSQSGGSEADGEIPAVRSRGRSVRPNLRNLDRVWTEGAFGL